MTKTVFFLSGLFIFGSAISQPVSNASKNPGLIKLTAGEKITIESTSSIDADLGMGMAVKSTSASINTLDIKAVSENIGTITNTLTKLQVNMDMMGQSNNYDSENKASNSGELASIFDSRLNKPTDISIDKTTGKVLAEPSHPGTKRKQEPNATPDLMSIFADNSDDAIVSGSFEIIPAGKVAGDSWSDSTVSKDIKIIRSYTLKSISGSEAVIDLEITSQAKNSLDFQGMEFEINTNSKTKSEIILDPATSLVKKKTSNSDINGSFQMMGQEMPILAKVTATSIYR